MRYLELAQKRESIRSFKSRQVPENLVMELRRHYAQIEKLIPDADTKLTFHGASIEETLSKHVGYEGMTFNAPLYIIVWVEEKDNALYEAGYVAEEMVLKITEMDLASCFLSVMDKEKLKESIGGPRDMEAAIAIAVGPGKKEIKRKLLHIFTPSDVKVTEVPGHLAPKIDMAEFVMGEVSLISDSVDPLLKDALYAASLAPSFLNRQPVRALLKNGILIFIMREDEMTGDRDYKLDLGVTIRNFDAVYFREGETLIGSPNEDIPEGYVAKAYRIL